MPLLLREGKRRNAQSQSVRFFLCASSKEVHLELVSDLTSEAFIAAFKRFITHFVEIDPRIYSDNETIFIDAHRQTRVYDMYNDSQVQSEIKNFLRELEISWSFIPLNAPHFGGLWKAAVKSAKYHMTRIMGKAHLIFEEMQTTLCERRSSIRVPSYH